MSQREAFGGSETKCSQLSLPSEVKLGQRQFTWERASDLTTYIPPRKGLGFFIWKKKKKTFLEINPVSGFRAKGDIRVSAKLCHWPAELLGSSLELGRVQ